MKEKGFEPRGSTFSVIILHITDFISGVVAQIPFIGIQQISAFSWVKQLLFGSYPMAAEWLLLAFLLFPKNGDHSYASKG